MSGMRKRRWWLAGLAVALLAACVDPGGIAELSRVVEDPGLVAIQTRTLKGCQSLRPRRGRGDGMPTPGLPEATRG